MNPEEKAAVVVGASGGIARVLIDEILAADSITRVIAISRADNDQARSSAPASRLRWIQSDNTKESMNRIVGDLKQMQLRINRIFVCNGMLHNDEINPEKRLKDVKRDSLESVFSVNAVLPILWLQCLLPLMPKTEANVVTVFSARVGSIDDNRAGGWYSYRASKAALNMMLKTVAVEYRRFSSSTRFLAFHPGTTDTNLSRPFQQNVPAGELFKPEFVASRLLKVIDDLPDEPMLNYVDWAGEAIAW